MSVYLRNPSLMDHYSFNRPWRDGWLSWPCWLTDSGRFTHKVVTQPAISLAQDRESSPARTGILTTMLRHQHKIKASVKDKGFARSVKAHEISGPSVVSPLLQMTGPRGVLVYRE